MSTASVQSVVTPQEIILKDHQKEWVEKSYSILMKTFGYVDTSTPGSGKTVTTLYNVKRTGGKLFVLAPPVLIPNWQREAEKYGVEIVAALSFQSLRGTRGNSLNHPYLKRTDFLDDETIFTPTEVFMDLLKSGIFLAIDEISFIKNDSTQHAACCALTQALVKYGGMNRFALLSGTPFDKPEHAYQLFRTLGFATHQKLHSYDRVNSEFVPEGINEVIAAAKLYEPEIAARLVDEIGLSVKTTVELCYQLYLNCVMPHIAGAMDFQGAIDVPLDVANMYYDIHPMFATALQKAVHNLHHLLRNTEDGKVKMDKSAICVINRELLAIENAQSYDMARVALYSVYNNPTDKVVICVNYTSSIKHIESLLRDALKIDSQNITVQALWGEIPMKKRSQIVDNFNNNPNCHYLIMNTQVGGMGISLHDTVGDARRHILISPSYKLLDNTQAVSRVYRTGLKGKSPVCRVFYPQGEGMQLLSILKAIDKKSKVVRSVVDENAIKSLPLPDMYPELKEEPFYPEAVARAAILKEAADKLNAKTSKQENPEKPQKKSCNLSTAPQKIAQQLGKIVI